jgi:uncharacterized protein YqiB (DUF1249 family)
MIITCWTNFCDICSCCQLCHIIAYLDYPDMKLRLVDTMNYLQVFLF